MTLAADVAHFGTRMAVKLAGTSHGRRNRRQHRPRCAVLSAVFANHTLVSRSARDSRSQGTRGYQSRVNLPLSSASPAYVQNASAGFFAFCGEAVVVWYSMGLRSTGLACILSLMILGCAANSPESASEARMWREQLERKQNGAHGRGRIGYIGNEGPVGN